MSVASFGGPAPFSFPGQQPPADVQCYDPAVEQLTEREMIAMGKEAVAAIQARGLAWVSDLGYTNRTFDFTAPLLSGDCNHAFWGTQPFTVVPDSPAALRDLLAY